MQFKFYHTVTRQIGVGLINPSRSKLWDCKNLYGIYVTHHLIFNIFLINVIVEYTDLHFSFELHGRSYPCVVFNGQCPHHAMTPRVCKHDKASLTPLQPQMGERESALFHENTASHLSQSSISFLITYHSSTEFWEICLLVYI